MFFFYENLDGSGKDSRQIHKPQVQEYVIRENLNNIYHTKFSGDVIKSLVGTIRQILVSVLQENKSQFKNRREFLGKYYLDTPSDVYLGTFWGDVINFLQEMNGQFFVSGFVQITLLQSKQNKHSKNFQNLLQCKKCEALESRRFFEPSQQDQVSAL